MNKGLFLSFEGLALNVIDSQVLRHCNEVKKIGLDFEIIIFTTNKVIYDLSLSRLKEAKKIANCNIRLFKAFKPAYPFSVFLNSYLLRKYIKKFNINFDFIHARTDYSASVASKIDKNFIWDCRGDGLSEYTNKKHILSFYNKCKIKSYIKDAKKANKAIFVSNFLKNKMNFAKESYVLPCFADSKLFYFDKYLRENTRKNLGILDKKVLIYSGSMLTYQCFESCIGFFKTLSADWIFLVLSPNLNEARKHLKTLKDNRYILKNVSFFEVNAYLNVADLGIILRENSDINKSASPTKYAEYCLSGLGIIYSDNIGDLDIYNKTIKNRILMDKIKIFDNEERKEIANRSKILDKRNIIDIYKKIYKF